MINFILFQKNYQLFSDNIQFFYRFAIIFHGNYFITLERLILYGIRNQIFLNHREVCAKFHYISYILDQLFRREIFFLSQIQRNRKQG